MKKLFAILFTMMMLFAAGCAAEEKTTFALAEEMVRILWDVDYTTFSDAKTTDFAEKYYAKSYLADYLKNREENAGTVDVKKDKLISHVIKVTDGGTAKRDGETVQKAEVVFRIDSFEPEDPELSYFEANKQFTLVYSVYFKDEEGQKKIDGFSFAPKDGAFLPKGEQTPLTEGELGKLRTLTTDYIYTRYNISSKIFDIDKQQKFYRDNATASFVERDGLDKNFFETMKSELEKYNVTITVEQATVSPGVQKVYYNGGEGGAFYYWADADYMYTVDADEAYYKLKDIGERTEQKERLYFEKDEAGAFRIAWAEYITS